MTVSATDALQRLREGNARFVRGEGRAIDTDPTRRNSLVDGQSPFAVILGCSDSRVPAEIVFDQGLGDLFIIRVAGNIVAPSLVGSVEFAATALGVRLVVVLGHTNCGAVQATLDSLKHDAPDLSPGLQSIVKRIRPSIDSLDESERNIKHAVQRNVHHSVTTLSAESEILRQAAIDVGLVIVGAEYDLATGKVAFLDESRIDSTVVRLL